MLFSIFLFCFKRKLEKLSELGLGYWNKLTLVSYEVLGKAIIIL